MPTLPENPNSAIDFSGIAIREIYLAGGCFWGVEAYLARVRGVFKTEVGYANGHTSNPSYEDVCGKNTGHAETVRLKYAPEILPLEKLLEAYFSIIDPCSVNRQGGDFGTQYRTGIYYVSDGDFELINNFLSAEQTRHEKPIAVELKPLENYYPAEEYHQKYLEKNPNGYCHIQF